RTKDQAGRVDGDGQRVAAVVFGDLPRVGAVADPGELVGHHGSEQLAVAVRLVRPIARGELDHLVDVQRLVASLAGSVLGRVDHGDVEPSAGEQVAEGAGLGFIGDRVDADPG